MADENQSKSRRERRKKQRIQLARGLLAKFGTSTAIIIDITDAGARIEHLSRFQVTRQAPFRFTWEARHIETEAMVVTCKVNRFVPGEQGATVYQSGLQFVGYKGQAASDLRFMVETIVARSLAEQVANARGIGPVIETTMPVFRSGVVAGSDEDGDGDREAHRERIPSDVVAPGYIRCTLEKGRWAKKWTTTADQPEDGFTVPAAEPADHVDQLCDTYRKADAEGRRLIRIFAAMTVDASA